MTMPYHVLASWRVQGCAAPCHRHREGLCCFKKRWTKVHLLADRQNCSLTNPPRCVGVAMANLDFGTTPLVVANDNKILSPVRASANFERELCPRCSGAQFTFIVVRWSFVMEMPRTIFSLSSA